MREVKVSQRKLDQKELDDLLSPIIKMWEDHSDKSYDKASEEWGNALTDHNTQPVQKNILWSTFHLLIANPIQHTWDWFKNNIEKSNTFENRTLIRLKKLKLISSNTNGELVILPAPINPLVGKYLICLLLGVIVVWLGWILFGDKKSYFLLIINSAIVGLGVGSLMALIQDLSYSRKEINDNLIKLNVKLLNCIEY